MSDHDDTRVTPAGEGVRRATVESVTLEKRTLQVEALRVEHTMPMGFRMGWATGKNEDTNAEFEVNCGAGVGSGWITARLGDQHYAINVRAILSALFEWHEDL